MIIDKQKNKKKTKKNLYKFFKLFKFFIVLNMDYLTIEFYFIRSNM